MGDVTDDEDVIGVDVQEVDRRRWIIGWTEALHVRRAGTRADAVLKDMSCFLGPGLSAVNDQRHGESQTAQKISHPCELFAAFVRQRAIRIFFHRFRLTMMDQENVHELLLCYYGPLRPCLKSHRE